MKPTSPGRTIAYDPRAMTIDGARKFLWSGAVHYPRSTPGMWPDLMRRSKDAGLNTIETYVFWNFHERKRNVFDFRAAWICCAFASWPSSTI